MYLYQHLMTENWHYPTSVHHWDFCSEKLFRGGLFHINLTYTALNGILETYFILIFDVDTHFFLWNPWMVMDGNGMNSQKLDCIYRTAVYQSGLWLIHSPTLPSPPLGALHHLPFDYIRTLGISPSLVMLYLLLLVTCLTSSLVFLLFKVAKTCSITFIPLCFLKYSFNLKSWYSRYCSALMPLTLMFVMAYELI